MTVRITSKQEHEHDSHLAAIVGHKNGGEEVEKCSIEFGNFLLVLVGTVYQESLKNGEHHCYSSQGGRVDIDEGKMGGSPVNRHF